MRSPLIVTAFVLTVTGLSRAADPLPPTAMPRDYAGPRPKPRTAAEVNAVLAGAPAPSSQTRPLRIVLVAGKKDHGKGNTTTPRGKRRGLRFSKWRTKSKWSRRGNGPSATSSRKPT
jgi:hypothetical protein